MMTRFIGLTVLVIMTMILGMRRGMRVTVSVRGETNRDWDDGLVGHAAAFTSSKHSQPLQDALE